MTARSKRSDANLVVLSSPPISEAETLERADDRPAIGSWWWLKTARRKDADRGTQWLGCVIELGSNYAKVEGVNLHVRIALDDFDDECKPEPNPHAFIDGKLAQHKGRVRELMGEIQRVCHLLGVPMRQALEAAQESTNALAIAHGTADVKAHKAALVKAKEKTLPKLFKQVEAEHKQMATWMKADLIPAKAELAIAETVTERIEQKIHTVELYAGLCEDLVQIRKGDPAPEDTKVCLMQRRLYMDEECLLHYESGGMRFEKIGDFDKWLARDEHFARIFPKVRCIVAFKVRRYRRNAFENQEEIGSLDNYIRLMFDQASGYKEDARTFLYIRNGQQLWRMETELEFEAELFPNKEDSELLGNEELWIYESEYEISRGDGVISSRTYGAMVDHYHAKRRKLARKLWAWHRAGKPDGHWECPLDPDDDGYGKQTTFTYSPSGSKSTTTLVTHKMLNGEPYRGTVNDSRHLRYVKLTPTSIYFDDVMKKIGKMTADHNRVAVIVQGLLDRSTCLHPHPPWRIWTAEGFAAGIELVYDQSRSLVPGPPPPVWEEYRKQLNKSLRPGARTIGQRSAWVDHLIKKYGHDYRRHGPWKETDGGPNIVDTIVKIRGKSATFAWSRERSYRRPVWVPAEQKGYIKPTFPEIEVTWSCPLAELTCIDGYTPGDFHLFFDDPRTREQYIQWAPTLLRMEDWHAKRRAKLNAKAAGDADGEDGEDGDDDE